MQDIKLDEIPLSQIDVLSTFNVREDFGKEETVDLEESLKSTNGNIQPIIVCVKGNRYELISGERRLRGLKSAGFEKALVIIYNNLSDLQRNELMFNENLGRKQLTWQEELKALKRLQSMGYDIDAEVLHKKQKLSKQKVWSLLEGLQAVEKYPELLKEKTRKKCIAKYRKIKRSEEGLDTEKKILMKKVITNQKNLKKMDSVVLQELKEEIKYYKAKSKNIYESVKNSDKVERLTNGIWLVNEVKQIIEASRTCETFGKMDEKDTECKNCKKESPNVYAKCEFYRDEIEKNEDS